MGHQNLITARDLKALMATEAPLVLLDCGFELTDPGAGQRSYDEGHLPRAHYAHLERDLSGPKTGCNGRHPLPTRLELARTMGRWGVKPGVLVVAYDDHALPYAARAWWLLRWMGHPDVVVLDGGRAAWLRAGGLLDRDLPPAWNAAPPYPAVAHAAMPSINAANLQALLSQPQLQLVDARAAERFRGELEPLDPVAGHIPGATLRFFKDNLGADGCFKPAAVLHAEFAALLAPSASNPVQAEPLVVHQCGSGVTACHNLLAMAQAGLGITTLYPGSWSEWCSDASRPMVRGPSTAA